jgi:YbbR domain-containing protein
MNFLRAIGNFLRFDRANWKAVLLCFIVAIVFWLFNAFNKSYSANVRFPLHFEYDADEFVAVSPLPNQMLVNVKGNGWDLFRSYFGIKLPELIIAVEKPLELKRIIGASLRPQLEPQLGRLQINYVVTDTLKLNLDERNAHRFKVTVAFQNISFKEGFGVISPVVILPDSVTLDGSKSLLLSFADSIVLSPSAKELSEDFDEEMEIPIPDLANLTRNPALVKVMFEVGKVVEIDRKVKVQIRGNDKTQWPDSISVKFIIPASQEENFNTSLERLRVKISKPTLSEKGQVPVVLNLPPYARVVSVDTLHYKK